ncbi:hypothetical protein [Arthrobacter sp. D1-17]
MSTPPVPPRNPNDPESGRHDANEPGREGGGQPQYGQNAPQYGQNAPQYGQNIPPAPQYGQQGQNPPQYGQNAPQSGQPQYGQNAPQYGQEPSSGQNPPQYGQPQYGQSPYGQSPYAQSPYGQQYPSEQAKGGPAGVPQSVNKAFWMIIAAGALTLLSTLLGIGTLDDPATRQMFEDQIQGSGQNIAFEDIKGLLVGTIVVFALIIAGLYALVAFNVRKGKNWARILGTVFAALSIFSVLPLGLNTVAVILGIAAIVMLYMPAASPYFQKPQPFANPYGGGPFGR